MAHIRFTEPTRTLTGLLLSLALAMLFFPLRAQSEGDSNFSYDISQEFSLSGTVSGVFARPAAGMIMGAHLLLTTVSGTVDVSLGRWGLQGKGTLSVAPGQQVEVTGVMKTLMEREVFLARTVTVGGKVYTTRNEHGISISPQARERASQNPAHQKELQ